MWGTFEKDGTQYCRFFTSRREHILQLVAILNGNLILEKRSKQFNRWVDEINEMWSLKIPKKKCTAKVCLDNGWLSGFSEADGGFYINVHKNFKAGVRPKQSAGHYINFITKFYITQLGEKDALLGIQALVGSTSKLGLVRNGRTNVKYNRLEIAHSNCIALFLKYFTKFPLKGSKNLDLLRLARVYGYKSMQRVFL